MRPTVVGAMQVGGRIHAFWGLEWELSELSWGNHHGGEREEVAWSHNRSETEQGVELGL